MQQCRKEDTQTQFGFVGLWQNGHFLTLLTVLWTLTVKAVLGDNIGQHHALQVQLAVLQNCHKQNSSSLQ